MIAVITRFNVLTVLLLLTFFGSNLLADQENSANASQELIDLEDNYAEVEIKLEEQSQELDRILALGYGGTGLGKDIKAIAEEVKSAQARLNDLKQQLDEELERLDALKDKQLVVNKIWLTDKAKGEEELKQIPEDSTAYFYVSFVMPMTLEALKINFTVTNKETGKEIVNVERERPRKGEGVEQKTGMALKADKLTLGENYQFTVSLIDADGNSIQDHKDFDIFDSTQEQENTESVAENNPNACRMAEYNHWKALQKERRDFYYGDDAEEHAFVAAKSEKLDDNAYLINKEIEFQKGRQQNIDKIIGAIQSKAGSRKLTKSEETTIARESMRRDELSRGINQMIKEKKVMHELNIPLLDKLMELLRRNHIRADKAAPLWKKEKQARRAYQAIKC